MFDWTVQQMHKKPNKEDTKWFVGTFVDEGYDRIMARMAARGVFPAGVDKTDKTVQLIAEECARLYPKRGGENLQAEWERTEEESGDGSTSEGVDSDQPGDN